MSLADIYGPTHSVVTGDVDSDWLLAEIEMLHGQVGSLKRELAEATSRETRLGYLAGGLASVVRSLPRKPKVPKCDYRAAPALRWAATAGPHDDPVTWSSQRPAWASEFESFRPERGAE